jgi:hypothetical protein
MRKLTKSQKEALTILKRAGLTNVDLRRNKASDRQLRKIKLFADVVAGEATTINKNKLDKKYSRIFKGLGDKIIVPKARFNETVIIKNKQLIIKKGLKSGYFTQIILPYNATDIIQLIDNLENDDLIPDRITDVNSDIVQQYAFSIYGETSLKAFTTKQELIDYVRNNYKHLFVDGDAVNHFSLVSYSGGSNVPEPIPESIAGEKINSPEGVGRSPEKTKIQNDIRRRKMYEAQKRYRDNLPDLKKKENKKKAVLRAKKSRAKRK